MDGAPVTLPLSRSCLSGWEGLGDSPSEELWVEVCVGLCASQLAGDYGGGPHPTVQITSQPPGLMKSPEGNPQAIVLEWDGSEY